MSVMGVCEYYGCVRELWVCVDMAGYNVMGKGTYQLKGRTQT